MESWDEESLSDNSGSEASEETTPETTKNKKGKKRQMSQDPQKLKKVKYEPISNEKPKKGNTKNDLYKAPTIEEITNLKETENLFNNNLFRLQTEELVKEITIKTKRIKAFNSWLNSFKSSIKELPEFNDILLSQIKLTSSKKLSKKEKFINSLAGGYKCKLNTDQELNLKFKKPENVESFGLYENNSCAGPHLDASVYVVMPKDCLHHKDYLNNRYLIKRHYYLLYLHQNVAGHKKTVSYHEDNILLPILKIQPTEDEKLGVKIFVVPPEDYFKPARFTSNINNVKDDFFNTKIKDVEVLKATPTVLYNSALGHDVTLIQNSQFIKETVAEHTHIQEGIKLICIWLKQRELSIGFGAFTDTLVLYLIAYLLSKKKINKFMSSYQVIRSFWNFIGTTDIQKSPISLCSASAETFDLFKKEFDVVFLDSTGCYNLAAFLNLEIFKKIKQECQMAMEHLDNGKVESFQSLFLTKLPFVLQYDAVLDVTESLPLEDLFLATDIEKSKAIGYEPFLNIKNLSDFLWKGLNKRILHLVPQIELNIDKGSIKKVLFGISLNPETAFNFIELGPALNDHVRADEFRKFWAHLSSDRRFRDGSTHVAVYFKTSTIRAKRGIVKRIIKFLLMEKLNINFKLYYDQFEDVLLSKKISSPYPIGTNEESSLKVIELADELGQKIRSAQMSLSITGIQGISDVFSYTNVFPPIASKFKPAKDVTEIGGQKVIFSNKKIGMMPKYVEAVELILQLEHSSKWPNDLEGVRHIKTSFYLEISKMLQERHDVISHVSRENLEVFYKGIVLRYKLYVPKEIALLKKESTDTGVTKYINTEESVELERTLNVLPILNGALKGLQLQFPSFGPGTALIKRWLRSQLIDDFFLPDVVVNLLNAALYVGNSIYAESCTPQVSFLRFLKFISEFHWDLQPLVVNFNNDLSKEDIADLESKFQQNRDAVQPLYIIMPYDQGQSLFTKKAPSKEILIRVQELAEATLKLFTQQITDQNLLSIKNFFTPNLEGFNLLIHLRPLQNPRRHEQIEPAGDSEIVLEKYENHKNEKIPINGFNPVQLYLKELREHYGNFAMFFHDSYGGNIIGVLWHPKTYEKKDFKVSYVNGRKLQDNKLVTNFDAIIEDFYILGKNLVKWIEKK